MESKVLLPQPDGPRMDDDLAAPQFERCAVDDRHGRLGSFEADRSKRMSLQVASIDLAIIDARGSCTKRRFEFADTRCRCDSR